jgi:uncharacterized membrane protein YcaP (DUF421 family)
MAAIFVRTLIIYLLLSLSLKIMGKRQLGELDVSELVSTLLVSEVASLPISDPDIPLLNAIIPILFIVSLEIIISSVKNKSEKLKHVVEGEPIFIIYKGKLKQNALKENRISINELLCELRTQGIGDIGDVYYAILEQNGKISVLERGEKENLAHTIIIDKEVNSKGLSALGYNESWLKKQLPKHKTKISDVLLMTVDDKGETNVIKRELDNEN